MQRAFGTARYICGSCVRKDGKLQVLLQRRAKHKVFSPDRYDTSSAGHIPAGSDYRESAIRELFRRELGVHAKAEDLVLRHAPRGV